MDGCTLDVGAVGALKGYISAIWVARQVLEVLPHTMIVGEGAALFAAERGAQGIGQLPQQVEAEYREWLHKHVPADVLLNWPDVPLAEYTWPAGACGKEKDTVAYLVRNSKEQFAVGTSTAGWGYKYPGRLGDAPIIGAGLYTDSKFGACACTHTGEMTMRTGTARAVVAYMKAGASVRDACHEAVSDLRAIKTGYKGPVVIHALDRNGEPYVVSTEEGAGIYWIWTDGSDRIQPLKAVVDTIDGIVKLFRDEFFSDF